MAAPIQSIKTPRALAGKYNLTRKLGEGGSGVTWLGRQTRDGSQEVVIKALKLSKIDDWKSLELFEREAQALKGLDLDGIPKLIEYIKSEDGPEGPRFYIVQSKIPGQTVAAMMAEGHRFNESEVINLGWQVAQLLIQLHTRKPPIIHRDLKPSNIMVRPDGSCALIDFGAVTDATGRAASVEGGETVVGTFGYMPPEQLRGRASAASDIYALGATMVHMLSGKSPASMDAKVFRLDFRPHVQASEPMLTLLERLLEPDETQRLNSAAALSEALTAVAKGPAKSTKQSDADPANALMRVAQDLSELRAVGQPGHLALFQATPEAVPRSVPWRYAGQLSKHAALWTVGGAAIITALIFGLGSVFRLGPLEIGVVGLMAAALVYFNFRQRLAIRHLIANGIKAKGWVLSVSVFGDGRTEIRYEFMTREQQRTSGKMNCAPKLPVVLAKGDEVGVLYLEADPRQNTLYPVPSGAINQIGA